MVPQPVKAVLMLFPITPATEAAKAEEEAQLRASGTAPTPEVWFTKQTISNACGTVAMLHAVANNPDLVPAEGSFLQRYFERVRFCRIPASHALLCACQPTCCNAMCLGRQCAHFLLLPAPRCRPRI